MKSVLVVAPCENWMAESAFRIRLGALADAMERRGFRWDIRARPAGPLARLALARSARAYHAVILHRKWLDAYEARALRRALLPGRKIFMDIDDATMLHETELGAVTRRRLDRRFMATAAILDVACTGNGYLAEIFQKKSIATRIIPSVVDPARYPIKQHGPVTAPRLVWIGSASTLKYLESALPALAEAGRRVPGLALSVICDKAPPAPPGLAIDFVPWALEGESGALLGGDIGIAPTPETPWTLGKCGYKIVQYMAAGLPVVASPVGVNSDLLTSEEPAGLLAGTWDDWPGAIEKLAADFMLRQTLGTAGRQKIERSLNLEKIADLWAEVLA